MKGVILAGGSGTRLRPLTRLVNKHLLPVGPYPMIQYAIQKMSQAGIQDIMLIIGKQSAGLYLDYLGTGSEFGVNLTYKLQEDAGGIAQALALAEGFIQPDDKFVVILGDNLFESDLGKYIEAFVNHQYSSMVLLKEVDDPSRYGVPILDGDRIRMIEEKPTDPKSNYCVTGIYFYNGDVFDVIRTIKPSERGELEITDVNNRYAAMNRLAYRILDGWWTDAGTFSSLLEANERLSQGRK